MNELITKVGNLKVIAKANYNNDFSVMVLNGSDIITRDVYTGGTLESATNDILQKLDYFTEDYLFLMVEGIERLTANTYKLNEDYFCRVDDTKYFLHQVEGDGWVTDKEGKRIIDR